VAERRVPDAAQVEEVAHQSLMVGRLLLLNGADTAEVEAAVARFAAAFGCEAHLMVSYEALLLTIVAGDHFRTKIGSRVSAMNVGMTAVEAINRLVDDVESGRRGLPEARAEMDAVEHRPPEYGRWLVVGALGLTAASLSRLFGGDWPTFAIAGLAGAAGTWLRQELGRRHLNPIVIPFAAAFLSGIVGGGAVLLGAGGIPVLCLVAPAMIIVPGVPLINGVQDMIKNHMTLGLSRLGFAGLVTVAIGFGLFAATAVTGAKIPVAAPTRVIGVPEDAVFSALAAAGYVLLFNVPLRMAWACIACGVASHTLRTLLFHHGIDLITGTLVGAVAASCLAEGFARRFRAPAAAFVFPGVVAMVPGAYAFRAVIGSLEIVRAPAAPQLVADTLALAITVMLMIGAIAVGVAAPALFPCPVAGRRGIKITGLFPQVGDRALRDEAVGAVVIGGRLDGRARERHALVGAGPDLGEAGRDRGLLRIEAGDDHTARHQLLALGPDELEMLDAAAGAAWDVDCRAQAKDVVGDLRTDASAGLPPEDGAAAEPGVEGGGVVVLAVAPQDEQLVAAFRAVGSPGRRQRRRRRQQTGRQAQHRPAHIVLTEPSVSGCVRKRPNSTGKARASPSRVCSAAGRAGTS